MRMLALPWAMLSGRTSAMLSRLSERRTSASSMRSSTPSFLTGATRVTVSSRRTLAVSTCRGCFPWCRRRPMCGSSGQSTSSAAPLQLMMRAPCFPRLGRLPSKLRRRRDLRSVCCILARTTRLRRTCLSPSWRLWCPHSTRGPRMESDSVCTSSAPLSSERRRSLRARKSLARSSPSETPRRGTQLPSLRRDTRVSSRSPSMLKRPTRASTRS
mmetsp:Transcript_60892/g.130905  ORF Transcript_60892/g.130905 Transcript_60892/m.130905 type:complete len:214 (+) Transcript_60892:615-1256(+)